MRRGRRATGTATTTTAAEEEAEGGHFEERAVGTHVAALGRAVAVHSLAGAHMEVVVCRSHFQGISRHIPGSWSMLHSVADCRYATVLQKYDCLNDPSKFPLQELFADMSQHACHQGSDLGIHLVTCSQPFSYGQDRLLAAQETCAMLGVDELICVSGCDARVPLEEAFFTRKRQKVDKVATLRDLAGNTVSQPDLGVILTCALLATPGAPYGDTFFAIGRSIPPTLCMTSGRNTMP